MLKKLAVAMAALCLAVAQPLYAQQGGAQGQTGGGGIVGGNGGGDQFAEEPQAFDSQTSVSEDPSFGSQEPSGEQGGLSGQVGTNE